MMRVLSFCSYILYAVLTGNHGQPTLEPQTGHFCPNVNITFICHDSNVTVMTWYAESYLEKQGIPYAPGFTENETMMVNGFYAQATNFDVDMDTGEFISVTTTLTVIASGIENGTNITCLTVRGGYRLMSSSILYFADLPRWKNTSVIICQENNTAVLELGDMFDGGGVPIDHYIIQVDNGTQLETPGPTYSFDIMYNTTLSVNISAHNCAGYSDLFPLEIQYDQDLELQCKQVIMGKDGTMTPRPKAGLSNHWVVVFLVIGIILLIIILLVIGISVHLIRRCIKHRSKHILPIATNIRMVNSGRNARVEYHSNTGTPEPAEYSYIPVTATRKYLERDCTGQYSTVINTSHCASSDNFIGTYAEIELVTTSSALPPPPMTGETVQYSRPSEKQPCRQAPQEPVQGEVGSNNERSHGQEDQEQNNAEPTDLHPLDKDISVHLILLQLRTVQSCWLALGEAAGLERETMDMIDVELGDDSAKLAEVVFRWYERKECVRWSDVSSLCEKIGFNQLSEAISTAYITGALPVKDDPEVELPISDKTPAPALPPRRATSGDNEGAPPITPHRPLICDGAPAVPPHRF
jgi:hypothetical protein